MATSSESFTAFRGDSWLDRSRFAFVCAGLFSLIVLIPDHFLLPLNHATAFLAGRCIRLFGGDASVAGDIITLDGFRVWIVTECTALYPVVLFSAFLLAVPASAKARLVGLLAGVPFLIAANNLRIALIAMIGASYPALFESAHVFLAQIVMIILVVAVSYAWLHMATSPIEMKAPFFVRILVLATVLFLPWLLLNETYVKALDCLARGIFALAGYRLVIPYGRLVYFQTFNMVLLLAMIGAERRLSFRLKAAWGGTGVCILAAGHLLFRIGNVLLTAFSWQPALPLTIAISVVGEYLLPLMIWLAATRAFTTLKERRS